MELFLSLEIDGGKKKKGKKKNYTTKKKIKHKHRNDKLATLKFYSFDEKTGKIVYKRKICPDCENGVFMAKHFDRFLF